MAIQSSRAGLSIAPPRPNRKRRPQRPWIAASPFGLLAMTAMAHHVRRASVEPSRRPARESRRHRLGFADMGTGDPAHRRRVHGAGPLLPIEFCRVSTTGVRKDFLTLVIDQDDGTLCKTYAAPSALATLEEAIDNLRRAGEDARRNIGFVDLASGKRSEAARRAPSRARSRRSPPGRRRTATTRRSGPRSRATSPSSASRSPPPPRSPISKSSKRADAAKFASALAYIRNAPPEVDTRRARGSGPALAAAPA